MSLSADNIGALRATDGKTVRVFVNGQPQTPGYQRRRQKEVLRRVIPIIALVGGGIIVIGLGLGLGLPARTVMPGVVWVGVVVLGVVMLFLGVRIFVRYSNALAAEQEKDARCVSSALFSC